MYEREQFLVRMLGRLVLSKISLFYIFLLSFSLLIFLSRQAIGIRITLYVVALWHSRLSWSLWHWQPRVRIPVQVQSSTLLICLGKHWKMAPVVGSLSTMWESRMEVQTPGFGLNQLQMLWQLREWTISLFLLPPSPFFLSFDQVL